MKEVAINKGHGLNLFVQQVIEKERGIEQEPNQQSQIKEAPISPFTTNLDTANKDKENKNFGLINDKPFPLLNRQELQQKWKEQNKNKQT